MTKEVSQGAASGNEVPVVARRRRHTRSDKLRILAEADRCVRHGELSALARREGVYPCILNRWKEWRERMQAEDTPAAGRPKSESYETLRGQLRQAERENHRLRMKLKRAEMLLDIQKKASELLAEMNRTDESCESEP